MRSFAENTIKAAAVSAGLAASAVMDSPEKDSITLPRPRLELEYMPEDLARSFKRIGKFAHAQTPETHRTVRSRVYRRTLTVRAVVQADDEDWLEAFVKDFLVALPHKTKDAEDNLVTVTAVRAVRGGFKTKTVEVFKKRSNALHVVFEGMIARDDDIALIREVNLVDGTTYKEAGNDGE